MTKLLVTGSAGFVGSNLIRRIIFDKLSFQLVGIDSLVLPAAKNNIFFNNKLSFHIADVQNLNLLDKVFDLEKPDIVIHLVGCSENHLNEIQYLDNIIKVSQKHNIKKIIYLSTSLLYGNSDQTQESSSIQPNDISSISKLTCENLLKISSIPYVIFRSTPLYGIRQSHSILSSYVQKLLNGDKVIDTSYDIMEPLWVEDLISAILLVLSNEGISNCILNIASGFHISEIQLVKLAAINLNVPLKNFSLHEKPRSSIFYPVDCSLLRNHNWKPSDKPKEILASVCRWYSNNVWYSKYT